MFKHILVPTDGSEVSNRVIDKAIALAQVLGAKLTFFNATPAAPMPITGSGDDARYDPDRPLRFAEAADKEAHAVLDPSIEAAKRAGLEADFVIDSSDMPYRAIIHAAETRGCDLIFMASHGRRGLEALLLGSETQKVLTHCKIPVLVYR